MKQKLRGLWNKSLCLLNFLRSLALWICLMKSEGKIAGRAHFQGLSWGPRQLNLPAEKLNLSLQFPRDKQFSYNEALTQVWHKTLMLYKDILHCLRQVSVSCREMSILFERSAETFLLIFVQT